MVLRALASQWNADKRETNLVPIVCHVPAEPLLDAMADQAYHVSVESCRLHLSNGSVLMALMPSLGGQASTCVPKFRKLTAYPQSYTSIAASSEKTCHTPTSCTKTFTISPKVHKVEPGLTRLLSIRLFVACPSRRTDALDTASRANQETRNAWSRKISFHIPNDLGRSTI